jgi:hypothetical protein
MFRHRNLLKAAILAGAAMFAMAGHARADYTLQILITDSLGNSFSTPVSSSFPGAGQLSYSQSTGLTIINDGTVNPPFPVIFVGSPFPEFTSLSVSVTSQQSAPNSFLNEVSVSGTVSTGFTTPNSLSITLIGSGFTLPPGPQVLATQDLSSSSLSGAFGSANLQSTLGGTTIASQTISPPNAGTPASKLISVTAPYDADQFLTITNIAPSTSTNNNSFNLTANTTWVPAVPEPASLMLFLTGLPVLGGAWLRRRFRKG